MPSSPAARARRMSSQLTITLAITEVLHHAGELSIRDVHAAVADILPRPICSRTVRRYLDTMVHLGFADRRSVPVGRPGRPPLHLYALATPAQLRDRAGLVVSRRRGAGGHTTNRFYANKAIR